MTKDIRIKEVELNNKSRKGTYIYVKEKGKNGRYYKKNKELKEKDYLTVYKQGGLRKKRGGITKDKIKVIRTIKKKKPIEIEKALMKGYSQTTIERAERLTPYGMKTAYMNLLRNKDKVGDGHGVIRDKELLEIITRPEDVEKWKHRIAYEVTIIGREGALGRMTNQVPKNLGIAIGEIKELARIGGEITSYDGTGTGRGKDFQAKEWNFERLGKGRITEIKMKMIFRKGK